MRPLLTSLSTAFALSLFLSRPAFPGYRTRYPDEEIVKRSDLIVVAHVVGDSIRCVPHPKDHSGASSWDHHALLAVTQIIKGSTDLKQVPITIHYRLEPTRGGYSKHDGFVINRTPPHPGVSPESILIFDRSTSSRGSESLVPDARDDHLWFLCRRSGQFGRELGTGALGIADPEELQPLSLRAYFLAYLSPDPESAVREQLKQNPAVGARALWYLQHREIQRILQEPDPARRAECLLPYYQSDGACWGEARKGLIGCGPAVGPYLRVLFDQPTNNRSRRLNIIQIWSEVKYKGAVDLLIELLEKDDQLFASVATRPEWATTQPTNSNLLDRAAEIEYCLGALAAIGDPRARPIIERTKARWQQIGHDERQIVLYAESALRQLSAQP